MQSSPDGDRLPSTGGNLYYDLAEIPVYTGAQIVQKRYRDQNPDGDFHFSLVLLPLSPNPARELTSAYAYICFNDFFLPVPQNLTVRVTTSVNDHVRNVKRNMVKHVFVSPETEEEFATPAQDQSDAVASYASPSGRLLIVLRETYAEDIHGKKRFVEVWDGDALRASQEVTKTHGGFYIDEVFSSYGFDKDETRFVYTADAHADIGSYSVNGGVPFDKFRYEAPLGEKFVGKKRPTIFVFRWNLHGDALPSLDSKTAHDHLSSQTLTSIVARIEPQNFSETVTLSFGQATLDETGGTIFATGYEYHADGRFPGLLGCYNRPSSIWSLKADPGDPENGVLRCVPLRLTPKDRSCRSSRYVRHGGKDYLVYLSHELGGPHHSCAQLRVLDFETMHDRVLVDTVWDADAARDEFPGLYLAVLPARPFLVLDEGLHVLLHSVRTHVSTMYRVCVASGECTRVIDQALERGHVFSWTVLATDGARAFLCSRSRTDVPNQLVLGSFARAGEEVRMRVIDKPQLTPRECAVSMALDRLCQTSFSLPHKPHVESVVIEVINEAASEGKEESVNPAIMIPHGGPHTSSTNAFNPFYAALALENYTLYLPNYTGSLGYGMKHVKELLGKCGEVDVQDCIDTTKGLIIKGVIKEGFGRQFIYGGSHGGFIAAHLIGQYPTFFSAAALRNPVINAGEMAATTDIPDWCYVEFGLKNSARLDTAGYAHLFRRSPVFHAQDIIAPVMLLLGEQDQRVPPSQGINLYHLLKGKGTHVDMLRFPGKGHSLEETESSGMAFEAIRWWFAKYRN
ncbi:hypothetical protein M0805_003922 [Coniferiporia weirii]|nr:hypothetical protein M0805_003922 [Coniferiporia weirii]